MNAVKATVFNLDRWKTAREILAEQWRQVGSVVEMAACERAEARLVGEIVEHLAKLPTQAGDLFDRSELVQLQEAARIASGLA
jgi:hypothetical protein